MTKSSKLRHTPLYPLSIKSQAKFTDFAGWKMPLQYSGVKKEHQAVRESIGMFDISHMGKFLLVGNNLRHKLSFLVPSDLTSLSPQQAKYSVLLNSQGGIIDDIIFYYQGKDKDNREKGLLIVNASTTAKDWEWLTSHLKDFPVTLFDYSGDLALIALQGVQGFDYLNHIVPEDLPPLASFGHLTTKIDNQEVFIARTGYTGEDGFEIMTTPQIAQSLWTQWLEMGVTPCGLGARDTLRLEAGMCLYGQDMNEETTPLEASLSWLIDFNHDFIARNILQEQKETGISKKLIALEMEGRYIARHGYAIVQENQVIGEVTSGTLSPTLNKAIALGYVSSNHSKIGQQLTVEIRGKQYPAKVVKKPFYRGSALRK